MSEFRKHNSYEPHFVTFTTIDWIPLFTRKQYTEVLIDSLKFCQKNKGLLISNYVIMSDHLHMICASENLSSTVRDFKSFTCKQLIRTLRENGNSRHRSWMIEMFRKAGEASNQNYQVWQNTSHPVILDSTEIFDQKVEYIHDNPVRSGLVQLPEHFFYSSAHEDSPIILDEL